MSKVLVVIPARLSATRLPDKPLADIAGEAMIVHVWRRAKEAGAGRVVVATDAEKIAQVIEEAGGEAVMTRSDHPSGSDRVHEVVERLDPDGDLDAVVNVQGDLPTLEPRLISDCLLPLGNTAVDIATLAAEITDPEERGNPNVVKIVSGLPNERGIMRAFYFTRATAPYGDGPLYHHIGLYAFRRASLDRFIALPPSSLEKRERLEQLRAIEDGMRIDVALVDTVPLGVDTPADLEKARELLSAGQD